MRLPVLPALLAAWLPGPAYADVLSIAVTPTSVSFGAATVLGNSIVRQISLIAGGPPIAVSIAIFVQTDCVKGQPAQCPWSEVTLTSPNCNVVPHLTSPSVYVIDVPLNFACLVNVAFRPTSVGPRQGQLFFPDNFPSPLIVPLDGIGVASEAIEVS